MKTVPPPSVDSVLPFRPRWIPAIAGLLLAAAGCDKKEQPATDAQPEKPQLQPAAQPELEGTRVEVAVLSPSESGLEMRVPGEVEGIRDAELAASLGGYIESLSVEEGEHVDKGAVLARVDSQTHASRLQRAQVDLEAAKRELKRAESLKGAIPQAEIDSVRDRVASAKAAVRELRVNVSRSVMQAPFSGVVTEVDAEVGEVASPGMPLFRLVQLQPIRVSVALSDRDLALAREGMPARVTLNASSGVYEGKIVSVSKAAKLKTRSFEAQVELPNEDEKLLPGMIAQVHLSTEPKGEKDASPEDEERLLISQDWLVTEPDGVGVFVAENGKARWRDVELGAVVRRQVEVERGLQPGDALIIVGHRQLADGDPILIHRKGTCCKEGRAVFSQDVAAEQKAGSPRVGSTDSVPTPPSEQQ